MKLKNLQLLIDKLPNAEIRVFGSTIRLQDKFGEPIGDINPYTNEITFYKDYTHIDKIDLEMFDRELQRELLYG